MQRPDRTVASVAYRCVVLRPRSHRVLAIREAGHDRLPVIQIPRKTRPAQELQEAIKARWGLEVLILEIWAARIGAWVVAELLAPEFNSSFEEIALDQFNDTEVPEQDRRYIELLCKGETKSPFSRVGWIEEAVTWLESAAGCRIVPRQFVEQWNAGGGFALLRMTSDDGRRYWLKATGEPNAHEFQMTRFLSEAHPDFLPKLVATKKEWNAWLTEDAGCPLSQPPSSAELLAAAKRVASLQVLTVGETDELLAAGAFDQRLPVLRSHIDAVIAYLIEAMARQRSTKAARLSRDRLLDLGAILRDACLRLEACGLPDALIHNDLNAGNILWDGVNYVFIDWSEAAVGFPNLTCERLCQLNRAHAESIRNVYREGWSHRLSSECMDEAIALAPLLAIYAYLYGRGDWLGQTKSVEPQFESYARSLARHMDRAAQDLSLLEIPCR